MFPNVFKIKHKSLNKYFFEKVRISNIDKSNFINKSKHCPPLVKGWYNSIYAFNKNIVKLLPVLDKNLYDLVNSYFNIYNINLDKKARSKRLRIKKMKSSTNRLLTSKLNLKHTNDKVNVTIYTYNRRKKYFINKMANSVGFVSPNLESIDINEVFTPFMENLKENVNNLELKVKKRTDVLLKEVVSYMKEKKHVPLAKYSNKFYIVDYVKKYMRKEIVSVQHKQSISFEESKNDKQYLLPLIGLIERIYNKKISFNIVNLKYFYNSGSIFSKALMTKLKNRKNKPMTVLTISLNTFELPPLYKFTVYNDMYNREKFIQNLPVRNLTYNDMRHETEKDTTHSILHSKDILDQSLVSFDNHNNYAMDPSMPEANLNRVIKLLKNKFTNGVRTEVAGRLTKRNTAERSIFNLKYKGSIKNLDSSHKRLPVVLLRGFAKPNIMYNQSKSKLRIGAFGLKTWISSS